MCVLLNAFETCFPQCITYILFSSSFSNIFFPPVNESEVTCGDPYSYNLCSAFNPSKCAHTHTHTHTRSSGQPMLWRPGSSCGFGSCSRAPQSWYWRWRERWLYTPSTVNTCRTWDSNPQPSGYKSDSLSIRPRLPLIKPLLNKKIKTKQTRKKKKLFYLLLVFPLAILTLYWNVTSKP